MGASEWIALAVLVSAIFTSAGAGLWKLASNKNELSKQFSDSQVTIGTEFMEVRKEIATIATELRREANETSAKTYRELGEGPRAIREHVSQVEIWMRDNLLPRREYERDQDKLLASIKMLTETIDRRLNIIDIKLDEMQRTKGQGLG